MKAKVTRMATDPMALRASIGGDKRYGYYITYRGNRAAILAMLRDVIKDFEDYQSAPEVPLTPERKKVRFGHS